MGKTQTTTPASALDFCLLVVCNPHYISPSFPFDLSDLLIRSWWQESPFPFLIEIDNFQEIFLPTRKF